MFIICFGFQTKFESICPHCTIWVGVQSRDQGKQLELRAKYVYIFAKSVSGTHFFLGPADE